MTDVAQFFGALAILVIVAAFARQVARWVGQPPVLGELVLGILLGPSLLGWVWPSGHDYILGGANLPLLEALAWVGLVLFMLTAGAEMQWRPRNALAAVGVGAGGLMVAGTTGGFLALVRPAWFFDGPSSGPGILLIGILLAVTALPILARLLGDLGLLGSTTAGVALASATLDDVVGWILLALAVAVGATGLTGSLAGNLALLVAIIGAALILDRMLTPIVARHLPAQPLHTFAAVIAATFGAALLTHAAGLHAVVGALVVGALVSRHPKLRHEIADRFHGIAEVLLLPLFFILTVGQADLRLVATGPGLIAACVVFAAAMLAKGGGAYLGARISRLSHTQSLAIATLVNARGAIGLVVAKVGYDAGLLSPSGFALLVLVVVATTLVTAPLAAWQIRRVGAEAL